MHTRNTILNLLSFSAAVFVLTALAVSLFSCRGEEVIYPTIGTHVTDDVQKGGLYILCEGNMGSNKARLDYMNLETGDYYSNWYGAQNPKQLKELGDVGNDIQQYGGKLYAVINCSHKLEIMDLQARHIAQIDIPNCRYIAFANGKAYVSAYVGSVADPEMLGSVFEIDTVSLEIKREVKVGHQPDELCVLNDRLYVVNSGGYLTNRYDSTVSVIDLTSFTEIQKIPAGLNPTRIRKDAQNQLWICCQGNYKDIDPYVVVLKDDQLIHRIDMPCANISIYDNTVGILDAENKELKTFSTTDFTPYTLHLTLSTYENPYALLVTDNAIYVSDAKNYVSSGVLHCYSLFGNECWSAKTGDIPGHLCRVTGAYDLHGDTLSPITDNRSPFIHRVYEYVPALGQFVNTLPKYEEGDNAETMCRKCEASIANNAQKVITLGGWGGYVTFGFDHSVQNGDGRDIQILGNAFYAAGSTEFGSSEPGIVLVSRDENKNGLPDDTWYELKGCLYDDPATNHAYTRTYTRAGDTIRNPFHKQPYYPQWIEAEELTFTGTLLPSQSVVNKGVVSSRILDFGYVDNKPNTDVEGTSFDISWAVDADGKPVNLPEVDFIRVYNAVDETFDNIGELSTEVAGAIDLHIEQ